jgi:glucokinase
MGGYKSGEFPEQYGIVSFEVLMNGILREVVYQKDLKKNAVSNRYCVLAGDIGGTNSNFGIFELQGSAQILLLSLHAKSQQVNDFALVTKQIITYVYDQYGIVIQHACFGAAGIINAKRDHVNPTNLSVPIDAPAIIQATGLKSLVLINDFEAVGLGIDWIDPKDIITINEGGPRLHAQKACIGAGTGMGKAALLWNSYFKRYVPFASEGGHADASAQTPEEEALFQYIMKGRELCPVSWEDILSGNGIKAIYRFLGERKRYQETAISKEIAEGDFMPDSISRYAQQDERCQDTFRLYSVFYARCAKNFVLDALALNGIYIAGGIAAKNIHLFKKPEFMQEFVRCGRHSFILQQVPVFVIADYNISLYGAAAFIELHRQGIV